MPLEVQGLTLSIDHQLYENPVYQPGTLAVNGINLITKTSIPIRFLIWDSKNSGGTVSNVRLVKEPYPQINCYEEMGYWVTEQAASHSHVLAGDLLFDVTRNVLEDDYVVTYNIPIRDLKKEVPFLDYGAILEQDGAYIDFSSLPLSKYEINKALYEFNQVTTNAYTSRVINLSNSETPNTVTGNRNGVAALNSLTTKNITVNIT